MPLSDVVKVEWSTASAPLATAPTWVDITSVVQDVTISRGRSGIFELYGTGRCTITVKNNTPTVDPTVWYKWRQVRVSEVGGEVLFRGFVDTTRQDQSRAPKLALATIECVDLLDVLSRVEYKSLTVVEERSGARITRMVSVAPTDSRNATTGANIPGAWLAIASGYVTMARPTTNIAGVDTDGALQVNVLAHAQDCAEAEIGGLYVSASGVLTFEDRYELLERLNSAASSTFSDTASGSEVSYLSGDLILTPPGTDYRNQITFTGDTQNPQTKSNVPTNYPADLLSRTLPMSSDEDAYANAVMWLEIARQSAVTWPENVTVPLWPNHATNLAQVTALDLRKYCQVKFTPVGKTQQTYKVFVERLEHHITPELWTCRVGFSSADRWVSAWTGKTTYLILDDVTYGKLDSARLGP